MHVADHVERPGPVAVVGEQPLADHHGRLDLGGAAQHVDFAEPLPAQPPQRPAQLVMLAVNDRRSERPVRAAGISLRTKTLRQVQHDRDGQHVVRAGEFHELLARERLHIGRVHDRQPAASQPLTRYISEHVERVGRGGLVVLVVGDQPAAEVAGQHLEWAEVLAGERGLAGAGYADEDDQGQLGDAELPAPRAAFFRAAFLRAAWFDVG